MIKIVPTHSKYHLVPSICTEQDGYNCTKVVVPKASMLHGGIDRNLAGSHLLSNHSAAATHFVTVLSAYKALRADSLIFYMYTF